MNEPHDLNRTVDVPTGLTDSRCTTDPPDAPVSFPGLGASASSLPAIPGYRVLREIARGGMGRVLAAHDLCLDRDVALKILLPGANTDRFVRESKITARLPHPGIPPVYALGTLPDGSPFLAMKLIAGQTLVDEMKTADRPRLLQAFTQVCQAVGFAHSKGVIHRDLKPANVMVGAFGEVQVMDWGLAKDLTSQEAADEPRSSEAPTVPCAADPIQTTDHHSSGESTDDQTQAGAVMGTPAYMAPEQARGEAAGARADVFALGGILCAILTGQPPFRGHSALEVIQRAGAADLAEANARLDGCGADRELIDLTKTCLAAEALDRPKDAQAVAEALARHLDGVQERLQQARLAEAEARARAAEEAKRRRLTLVLAATVLLAVLLGGGGWLWVKVDRDARQTLVSREVNEALSQATAFREQAKAAPVGGSALFARAREQAQRASALAENGPADERLQAQVRSLRAELDAEEKDQHLVAALDAAQLAHAATVVGENRFAVERAVPKFRDALEAYGLPAGEGEPEAVAARIRERPARVRATFVAALDEWIDLAADPRFGIREPHLDWLRAVVVAAEPPDAWTRRFRAARQQKDRAKQREALEKLAADADVGALPASSLERLASALQAVHAEAGALRLRRLTQQQYSDDFRANHKLAAELQNLKPPEHAEAVRYLTAAVALRPESPGARLNLGLALSRNGQVDEAIACYQKAIRLDPTYSTARNNLGVALEEKGQVDEAVACFRVATALDPKDAALHYNLGNALSRMGKVDEAVACYRKAVALDPKFVQAHYNLGLGLAGKGEMDEAVACFRQAVAVDPTFARAHINLGNALKARGEVDAAIACFRQAIELDPKDAKVYTNLARSLAGKGKVDEAVACYRQAVALDPKDAKSYNQLGILLCDVKRDYDGAIACFRKAVGLSPNDVRAHFNLGNALRGKGKMDEAIACYRQAVAVDPTFPDAHTNLGGVLYLLGQIDEAVACLRKAVALDPKLLQPHTILGLALARKGQVDEAVACYEKAVALDPKNASTHVALGQLLFGNGRFSLARDALARAVPLLPADHPVREGVSERVKDCERLLKLEARLPRLLRGEEKPGSARESLDVVTLCQHRRLNVAAVRFWTEAFAAGPRLANDLGAGRRYDAACCASRAVAGQGVDAGKLDDVTRAKLRRQALDWLKTDLAGWGKLLASDPTQARPAIVKILSHWEKDSDLAGLRDAAALEKLPAEEQKACTQLWTDVAALLKKAEEKPNES